jgi:hypothetical protein
MNSELPRLEAEAKAKDTYRICHHSHKVCCNGFWNKHKDNFNLGRVAQRLNMVRFVDDDNFK